MATTSNHSAKEPKKLLVLHIYKFLYDGGTEKYIHTLISRMNHERFTFQICCLMERGSKAKAFEDDGFPVYSLNFKPGLSPAVLPGNLIQVIRLARLIRRIGADIVHTHDNQPAAYARMAAWLARVPIVYVTLHNDYSWLSSAQHRINRLLAFLTTRIFAVSATVRDISSAKEQIPKEKYCVIHNGVAFAAPAKQTSITQYREQWHLGPTARVIGNVASLSHRKGQDLLIEAFGKIASDFPDVYLFIVGSPREDEPDVEQNLIEIASRYGIENRVVFTGSRSDVLDILHIFEIFVMSSRIEGFGLSLIEAICAGVPAVTSDIPTFTEICEDGKHALSFRSEDSHSLAEKLRYALTHQDEMREMGGSAKQYARQHFSIEHMVAQYERAYEEDLSATGLHNG